MGARKGLPYFADTVPQADHPDGPHVDCGPWDPHRKTAGHEARPGVKQGGDLRYGVELDQEVVSPLSKPSEKTTSAASKAKETIPVSQALELVVS